MNKLLVDKYDPIRHELGAGTGGRACFGNSRRSREFVFMSSIR